MAFETDLESTVEPANDVPEASEVHDPDEEITIDEVFDRTFMGEHTEFHVFDEMVAASPSNASSADDLKRVPTGEWDEFVAETTAFDDTEEMVFAARDYWVAKKLDL